MHDKAGRAGGVIKLHLTHSIDDAASSQAYELRAIKNPGCCQPGFLEFRNRNLHGLHFVSLHTFLAFHEHEAHFLAFLQRLEAVTLYRAEVYKHIFAAFRGDKTKTLSVVEPLHSAGCHVRTLSSLFLSRSDLPAAPRTSAPSGLAGGTR